MKTVKTLAEATRLAAQSGATLEVGGRVVNAAGTKMTVVKPTPAPPPVVASPPPAADPMERVIEVMGLQAKISAAQAQSMSQVMAEVLASIHSQPAAAPAMRPSSFTIIRDERGLISSIVPVYQAEQPQPSGT